MIRALNKLLFIFYYFLFLSKLLNKVELNYSMIEKLCLVLYFTASKLRHYMLSHVTYIITQTNICYLDLFCMVEWVNGV